MGYYKLHKVINVFVYYITTLDTARKRIEKIILSKNMKIQLLIDVILYNSI